MDKTTHITHSQAATRLLASFRPFHQRPRTSPSLDRLYPLLRTVFSANNTSSNRMDVGTFSPNQYKPCVIQCLTRNNYKFTSQCLFETPTVGAPGRGLCAFQTRPRMANHDISWVPGAHMRFGNLDFIIMVGGELVWAHAAIQSLPPIGLDDKRLRRQLGASLGL